MENDLLRVGDRTAGKSVVVALLRVWPHSREHTSLAWVLARTCEAQLAQPTPRDATTPELVNVQYRECF